MHHSMEAIELFNLKALGCHRLTCPAAPSLERITLDADCEVPNRAVWIDPARDENSASRSRLALMRSASAGFRFRRAIFKIVMGLQIHPELRAIAKVQAERDE